LQRSTDILAGLKGQEPPPSSRGEDKEENGRKRGRKGVGREGREKDG